MISVGKEFASYSYVPIAYVCVGPTSKPTAELTLLVVLTDYPGGIVAPTPIYLIRKFISFRL